MSVGALPSFQELLHSAMGHSTSELLVGVSPGRDGRRQNKTSNQRNCILSSRRGQPLEHWLGEGRAPLGWGTSKTGLGLRIQGRCQGRTCRWVGPSSTAKPLGTPSTQAPFSVVGTQCRPLLASLGLAGDSGVLECSGQRPSLHAVSTQRVTAPFLPLLSSPLLLHLQHLAFSLES